MGLKLCIAAESSNALFQLCTTERRQNEKICQDIDDVSGEDYEAEIYRAANWQFHVATQSPN
jgi:hypothetical protein